MASPEAAAWSCVGSAPSPPELLSRGSGAIRQPGRPWRSLPRDWPGSSRRRPCSTEFRSTEPRPLRQRGRAHCSACLSIRNSAQPDARAPCRQRARSSGNLRTQLNGGWQMDGRCGREKGRTDTASHVASMSHGVAGKDGKRRFVQCPRIRRPNSCRERPYPLGADAEWHERSMRTPSADCLSLAVDHCSDR